MVYKHFYTQPRAHTLPAHSIAWASSHRNVCVCASSGVVRGPREGTAYIRNGSTFFNTAIVFTAPSPHPPAGYRPCADGLVPRCSFPLSPADMALQSSMGKWAERGATYHSLIEVPSTSRLEQQRGGLLGRDRLILPLLLLGCSWCWLMLFGVVHQHYYHFGFCCHTFLTLVLSFFPYAAARLSCRSFRDVSVTICGLVVRSFRGRLERSGSARWRFISFDAFQCKLRTLGCSGWSVLIRWTNPEAL